MITALVEREELAVPVVLAALVSRQVLVLRDRLARLAQVQDQA